MSPHLYLIFFQNSEPPITCYKYNKPIRNKIFIFNNFVSDPDIDLILLIHKSVKISNLFTHQQAMLSLDI